MSRPTGGLPVGKAKVAMKIYSAVVSQVVPVGFTDLAEAADELPGREISEDRVRLRVGRRAGTGLGGATRFAGTLRTGAGLLPPIKVEVVVSAWSVHRSEVAIHPITSLGQLDSLRAQRFYNAAHSILRLVIDRLNAELPVEVPVELQLAA
jgi:hypothetical protein